MNMITLDYENIEKEHICCAISSNNDLQVKSKKEWLKQRLDDGLIFTKMDIRGKCFIEYLPLEKAWVPIIGSDLMYINCLWVAGKYQGMGYANALLEDCRDKSISLGKKGLVILSSKKKLAFLMDYQFLTKFGFYSVGTWNDVYELMFLPIATDYQEPYYKIPTIQQDGLVLYYTHQCPFNAKYVQVLKEYCQQNNIPIQLVHLQSQEEAKNAPTPLTTYSLFYNGKFITREVLNARKFEKLWGEIHE